MSQHFAQAGPRGLSTYLRVTLREYRRYRAVPVRADLDGREMQHRLLRAGLRQCLAVRQQRLHRAPGRPARRPARRVPD
ncbi:MAG: hypothetical protein WKG07_28945 [Hymenobacter sp.]